MKKFILAIALNAVLIGGFPGLTLADNFSFTTINDPLSPNSGTFITSVGSVYAVGCYPDANKNSQGFFYNLSTGQYTSVIDPNANEYSTILWGTSGTQAYGRYWVNNGGNFTGSALTTDGQNFTDYNINPSPIPGGTTLTGASGAVRVGTYQDANYSFNGFMESGGITTTINDPNAVRHGFNILDGTMVLGISGNLIVGSYLDGNYHSHGFVTTGPNANQFIDINDPLAVNFAEGAFTTHGVWNNFGTSPAGGTVAEGTDGNYIVGYYFDANGIAHGYVLNHAGTYTTVDDPLAVNGTYISGIYGDTLAGWYFDANNKKHGFIAQTVPEPSSAMLIALGLGGFAFLRRRAS